jgi:hypothetical protein
MCITFLWTHVLFWHVYWQYPPLFLPPPLPIYIYLPFIYIVYHVKPFNSLEKIRGHTNLNLCFFRIPSLLGWLRDPATRLQPLIETRRRTFASWKGLSQCPFSSSSLRANLSASPAIPERSATKTCTTGSSHLYAHKKVEDNITHQHHRCNQPKEHLKPL